MELNIKEILTFLTYYDFGNRNWKNQCYKVSADMSNNITPTYIMKSQACLLEQLPQFKDIDQHAKAHNHNSKFKEKIDKLIQEQPKTFDVKTIAEWEAQKEEENNKQEPLVYEIDKKHIKSGSIEKFTLRNNIMKSFQKLRDSKTHDTLILRVPCAIKSIKQGYIETIIGRKMVIEMDTETVIENLGKEFDKVTQQKTIVPCKKDEAITKHHNEL